MRNYIHKREEKKKRKITILKVILVSVSNISKTSLYYDHVTQNTYIYT